MPRQSEEFADRGIRVRMRAEHEEIIEGAEEGHKFVEPLIRLSERPQAFFPGESMQLHDLLVGTAVIDPALDERNVPLRHGVFAGRHPPISRARWTRGKVGAERRAASESEDDIRVRSVPGLYQRQAKDALRNELLKREGSPKIAVGKYVLAANGTLQNLANKFETLHRLDYH